MDDADFGTIVRLEDLSQRKGYFGDILFAVFTEYRQVLDGLLANGHVFILAQVQHGIYSRFRELGEVLEETGDELGGESLFVRRSFHSLDDFFKFNLVLQIEQMAGDECISRVESAGVGRWT